MNGNGEGTTTFETGAKRSSAGEHLDFTSLPGLGMIALARVAHEGQVKYGRLNYARGMPAWKCVNRAIIHLVKWCMGCTSEPHLEHAAWNCLAAIQFRITHPDLNAPHEMGPGLTLTPEVLAHLEAGDPERDRKREAGEFEKEGKWKTADLPEVREILRQRKDAKETTAAPEEPAEGWISAEGRAYTFKIDGQEFHSATWHREKDGGFLRRVGGWWIIPSLRGVAGMAYAIRTPWGRLHEEGGRTKYYPYEMQAWNRAEELARSNILESSPAEHRPGGGQ